MKKMLLLIAIFIACSFIAIAAKIESKANPKRGRAGVHGPNCVYCHIPPQKSSGEEVVGEALWDHGESNSRFEMYVTLSGNIGALDGPSRLCLSCHDGVTALDNHDGINAGSSSVPVRTDLGDDHPIGIQYPPRDRDGYLLERYHYKPRGNVKLYLVNGVRRVECSSCHDPHGTPYEHDLREPVTGNSICLDCHDR